MTRWGLPLAFDSGNNDPQRVITTRWGLSFCLHPPNTAPASQRVISTRWGLPRVRLRQQRPPTSRNDSLGAFLLSSPPETAPAAPTCHFDTLGASSPFDSGNNDPQRVVMTRWGLSFCLHPPKWHQRPQRVISTRWGLPLAFDSGNNDPQRVITTRWGLSFCLHPPNTAPATPTCHFDTLGASSPFDSGNNDPNESLRLVGGFTSVSTPNNRTNTPNES